MRLSGHLVFIVRGMLSSHSSTRTIVIVVSTISCTQLEFSGLENQNILAVRMSHHATSCGAGRRADKQTARRTNKQTAGRTNKQTVSRERSLREGFHSSIRPSGRSFCRLFLAAVVHSIVSFLLPSFCPFESLTMASEAPLPSNSLVTSLLTDLYQITMTYAHWKNNRHNDAAIFELFFRKNPFGGGCTIFCGLDECLKYVSNFAFSEDDINYLKSAPALSQCDPAFFDEYLKNLTCEGVTIRALQEGTVAFPKVPLIIVEGPLGIGQLLETTLLTLVNFPSLIATNDSRMVRAAATSQRLTDSGSNNNNNKDSTVRFSQQRKEPKCIEFGLRRAQGPDGGFSASKYASVGGFVGTSNVQAGKVLGLPVAGTHAHAFVQAYYSLDQVKTLSVANKKTTATDSNDNDLVLLLPRVLEYRQKMGPDYENTNDGELAAFVAYAAAFPASFLCLIDTYDTIRSGLRNFLLVCLVLDDCGYKPRGIRLDSGDLAALSIDCARVFDDFAKDRPFFADLDIVASDGINEKSLRSMGNHAITLFGIGTNLVTCQAQPALGCVYKLVEIEGRPRMKLSQTIEKVLIPGAKSAYRLIGKDGRALADLMVGKGNPAPVAGEKVLCRHPFQEGDRVNITPSRVDPLHSVVFQNGRLTEPIPSIAASQAYVREQLSTLVPEEILHPSDPTTYRVGVSQSLYAFLHELWQSETPIPELS